MTSTRSSLQASPTRGTSRGLVIWVLAALVVVLPAAPAVSQEAPRPTVRRVAVEGNRLIETATITVRLLTVEGAPFDPETVSQDIRSIYALGYFEDVQVKAEGFEGGLAVTFVVKEKPLITRIEFRGQKEVKTDDLRKATEVKVNSVVDESAIRRSAEQVLMLLRDKGYYRATADHRLEEVAAGEMTLIFLVTEGERMLVRKIEIRGNEALDADDIRGAMETEEKGFFSFLTKSGSLVPEQLEDDVLRILAFMYNHGHIKARVDEPVVEVDEADKSLKVVVTVHEGPRYAVGRVEVPGDEHFPPDRVLAVMKTATGQVFRRDVLAQDIGAVTALYTDIGFAFCRVDARTAVDDEKKTVDLRLAIEPGPLVKVGRIHISGNQTTRDNVIRREVVLREGETFSSRALAKSRQRVQNLGFFDKVDITTQPRGEDVVDVDIAVTERLTGAVSFGVGYSSDTGVGGIFKLTEENLLGRGYRTQASIEYGTDAQQFNLYFFNPSIFDGPFSFGVRGYDTTNEYDQFDREATGGSLTFGRTLGEYYRGFVTFKAEQVTVSDVGEDASLYIKEQEGGSNTHSTTLSLVRDSRDNYFNPTRGARVELRGEYAGGFQGGDNYFTKLDGQGTVYFPLVWKLVLSLHAEYGQVEGFDGREVPIHEKYFLGGINDVRGYEFRSIGPKDENGDAIGGLRKVVGNAEIIFPISEEQRLSGVLFFDAGQAYGDGESLDPGLLKTSVGAGVRWLSPIGPFRIEWGYALDPEPDERRSDWHFSVGAAF